MQTSSSRRYRILIADDHALLADGIATLLRPDYEIAAIALNGRETVAQAERLRPDVITLDIGMPGLNGLEAARQIRRILPRVKIVFVTQQIDLRYLKAALATGAEGFVAKQSASSELIKAVEQVLAGRRYITPLLEEAYAAVAPASLQSRKADNGAGGEAVEKLTARQREVLQLLAEGHTNKSIAAELAVSVKTVEYHKDMMMRTLGVRTTAELTRYAVAQGLIDS